MMAPWSRKSTLCWWFLVFANDLCHALRTLQALNPWSPTLTDSWHLTFQTRCENSMLCPGKCTNDESMKSMLFAMLHPQFHKMKTLFGGVPLTRQQAQRWWWRVHTVKKWANKIKKVRWHEKPLLIHFSSCCWLKEAFALDPFENHFERGKEKSNRTQLTPKSPSCVVSRFVRDTTVQFRCEVSLGRSFVVPRGISSACPGRVAADLSAPCARPPWQSKRWTGCPPFGGSRSVPPPGRRSLSNFSTPFLAPNEGPCGSSHCCPRGSKCNRRLRCKSEFLHRRPSSIVGSCPIPTRSWSRSPRFRNRPNDCWESCQVKHGWLAELLENSNGVPQNRQCRLERREKWWSVECDFSSPIAAAVQIQIPLVAVVVAVLVVLRPSAPAVPLGDAPTGSSAASRSSPGPIPNKRLRKCRKCQCSRPWR